jgi:hypothetical protein
MRVIFRRRFNKQNDSLIDYDYTDRLKLDYLRAEKGTLEKNETEYVLKFMDIFTSNFYNGEFHKDPNKNLFNGIEQKRESWRGNRQRLREAMNYEYRTGSIVEYNEMIPSDTPCNLNDHISLGKHEVKQIYTEKSTKTQFIVMEHSLSEYSVYNKKLKTTEIKPKAYVIKRINKGEWTLKTNFKMKVK